MPNTLLAQCLRPPECRRLLSAIYRQKPGDPAPVLGLGSEGGPHSLGPTPGILRPQSATVRPRGRVRRPGGRAWAAQEPLSSQPERPGQRRLLPNKARAAGPAQAPAGRSRLPTSSSSCAVLTPGQLALHAVPVAPGRPHPDKPQQTAEHPPERSFHLEPVESSLWNFPRAPLRT